MAFTISAIAKAKRKRRAAPADPPFGTYDPQLDATGRSNQRGYDDYRQDYQIGSTRGQDDLLIALGQNTRGTQNELADLTTGRDRSLADLLRNRGRATEDHTTALGDLDRSYATLANRQGQNARRAHVEGPGIMAQALAKRTENRALDQKPIDTSFNRYLEDSKTSQGRIGEDFARGTSRVNEASQENQAALNLGFDRLWGSTGTNTLGLARAGRDVEAGNLDLSQQRWWQAAAAGYSPPRRRRRNSGMRII